jgi:uncharacterized protein (DUF1800 family)
MTMNRSTLAVLLVSLTTCFSAFGADLASRDQALHVLNRLGYGPRPGDIDRVLQMGVERYIATQLTPSSIPLPNELSQKLAALDSEHESAGQSLAAFQEVRAAVKAQDADARAERAAVVARMHEQSAQARLLRATESPRQLEEVMVDFWFNHFNVFSGKGLDKALVNSYERDAIRPNALGSFRTLLGATAKHPAMLFYLDNWTSTGAGLHPGGARAQPAAGAKAKATGLNENYARELMELHTLGVDGGYTQDDVTALARMLTGWTFAPRALITKGEQFRFDDTRHDTGDKEWLGRHVASQGQREGEFALGVLARHPATAHHISYELAQYFVQDQPPAALVDRLAKRFLETDGDIRSVLQTLFASPEFMAPAARAAKFKTPYQYVVSAVRASGAPVVNVRPLLGTLHQLGMPLYGCQTPDGYANTQAAWLNPDALTRRISFATALGSGRLPLSRQPDPVVPKRQVAQAMQTPRVDAGGAADAGGAGGGPVDAGAVLATLGSGISAKTGQAIESSPPPLRAAMLLGSPDFMMH